MVMRLRCLIVFVFSWKHGPMYRCWLYATVAHVQEGFLRLLYRMKQPVLFGWKKLLRQDIPGAFPPICCLFLGTLCWWSAVAFLLWKCVSWGGLGAAMLCPPRLLGKFMTAWSGEHKESFLCLLVSPSQWKQSFVSHWAVMNHKIMFLKNLRLFSPRCFVHAVCLLPRKSVSCYIFFFLFFGWANSREHWSQLNGLEV